MPPRSDGAEQLNKLRRRREIVAAANRIVAHKGIKGVTLRAVANATGLTAGGIFYYYDSLDALFTAVYDRSIERFCRHRERAVGGIEDPAQRIATAVRLGIPAGPDDPEIRALYELESVAFRNPACMALMVAYVERQVAIYAAILEVGAATGVFRLSGIARNIVALEDGQGCTC